MSKTLLLITALILCAASCHSPKSKADSDYDYGYKTIIYDGCEYVEYFSQSHAILTHKGNCKNCRKFAKENK